MLDFQLKEEYDVVSVLGLLALASENEIDFGVAIEPGWFPFNCVKSIVYDLRAFEDPEPSANTRPTVPMRYQDELRDDGMGATLTQAERH